MQLLADLVVLRAVADQLAQPLLEIMRTVAQREDLALRDGNRVAAVRMRNERSAQLRRRSPRRTRGYSSDNRQLHLHPSGSFFLSSGRVQDADSDAAPGSTYRHSPSNTVCAGPFIVTGPPSP